MEERALPTARRGIRPPRDEGKGAVAEAAAKPSARRVLVNGAPWVEGAASSRPPPCGPAASVATIDVTIDAAVGWLMLRFDGARGVACKARAAAASATGGGDGGDGDVPQTPRARTRAQVRRRLGGSPPGKPVDRRF